MSYSAPATSRQSSSFSSTALAATLRQIIRRGQSLVPAATDNIDVIMRQVQDRAMQASSLVTAFQACLMT
jgi:hypothetical protein